MRTGWSIGESQMINQMITSDKITKTRGIYHGKKLQNQRRRSRATKGS